MYVYMFICMSESLYVWILNVSLYGWFVYYDLIHQKLHGYLLLVCMQLARVYVQCIRMQVRVSFDEFGVSLSLVGTLYASTHITLDM
jgi:hypothetical protein